MTSIDFGRVLSKADEGDTILPLAIRGLEMTTVKTFTFFGSIRDRDHFDLLSHALRTSVRLHQDPVDYLIDIAETGKQVSIMGGTRQLLGPVAEACEEIGLEYQITEISQAGAPLRRECWQPGASRPFVVQLTPDGEAAYTAEQITDAIQAAGSVRVIQTLQRWAQVGQPVILKVEPAIIEELRLERSPRL